MADRDATGANEQKLRQHAADQRSNLRKRVNDVATAVIQGNLSVSTGYKPRKIQDPDHPEWLTLMKSLESLRRRIELAKSDQDKTTAKETLQMSVRADFPDIAKKFPAPVFTAPPAESALSPRSPATEVEKRLASAKRKLIDDTDKDDEEVYDPEIGAKAQREQRAAKRQRSAANASSSRSKAVMDQTELDMEIQEIKMKADLQIHQLKRKFNAEKKDKKELDMETQEIRMKADLQIHQLKRKFEAEKKKREATGPAKIKTEK